MRAIIVDDEDSARELIRISLEENCPDIQIVGEAHNVPSAVALIHKEGPDLIFLDVEMPGYLGFQILDFFEDPKFKIIFITAYSEYALHAIKASAVDYLLKPLQVHELIAAVQKASAKRDEENIQQLKNLKQYVNNPENPEKIAIHSTDGILFYPLRDIIYLKADGSYTYVVNKQNDKLLVSKKIKEFEHLESLPYFFRCHRSYLINLKEVIKYAKADGGYILMSNSDQIPISREKKDEFLEVIRQSGVV